jgi:nitrate/nitrite transporter NarK
MKTQTLPITYILNRVIMEMIRERKFFKYPRLAQLWIAVFIDILGFSLILPMSGFFQELYNTSTIMIGLVLSVNAMFGFIFEPVLGKLSDNFGRRPLLLISHYLNQLSKNLEKAMQLE